MRNFAVVLLAASLFSGLSHRRACAAESLSDLSDADFQARVAEDLVTLKRHRHGLNTIIEFISSRPDLFPLAKPESPRVLRADQRAEISAAWKSALDYTLALDSLGKYHSEFYGFKAADRQRHSFLVAHSAFLAQYAFALHFIEIVQRDPALDVVLNESVPDLGLPLDMYAKYKFRFLNVARAGEFAAQKVALNALWLNRDIPDAADMREDSELILKAGRWQGPLMTLQNGLKIIKDAGFTAWFPVQAGVSEWMGDTRVRRKDLFLVTQEQIAELAPLLEPGDILLERREWYLSNVGLPGFWPHAALYIGTPDQRRSYFDDPEVRAWLSRLDSEDLESHLLRRNADAYPLSLQPREDGHVPRVIEAMSEGVLFTTLEHSAAADSLSVIRPRLGKAAKAQAIARAFGFVGKPYDFDFDFTTNEAMVCTEVVSKAYESGPGMPKGLSLPLTTVMGRPVTPANEIARLVVREIDAEQPQFDFVLFLDGFEKQGKALPSDLKEFCHSVDRPKWHIFFQDTPEND